MATEKIDTFEPPLSPSRAAPAPPVPLEVPLEGATKSDSDSDDLLSPEKSKTERMRLFHRRRASSEVRV